MSSARRKYPEKEIPTTFDHKLAQWQDRLITPAQLLVHDVRLETRRSDRGPLLEVIEKSAWSLVPDDAVYTPSEGFIRAANATDNPIDKQRFARLEEEYGWMRNLRSRHYQRTEYDPEEAAKCRWIHCSAKFPEYLHGFLWALSDDLNAIAESMKLLEHTTQRHTRFSKHGKTFAPFSQTLRSQSATAKGHSYPMLISVPFLDWSILGPTPPLRFQVDKREQYRSARSSAHLVRSILQYYYRLEDTSDREKSQVFNKHKPWSTNRELDLKIRQWYGHYPSALNVDELWILVIDPEHIVTFSSNQTWKSRYPPLQLTSRISDVAFRGIRNNFFISEAGQEYTAMTHAIACLSGAVGIMHRNFWADMALCLTDRYAGHLGHLQYRLHRSPSTKLVMDLIGCQEELNIVIQITEQQIDMIRELKSNLDSFKPISDGPRTASPVRRTHIPSTFSDYGEFDSMPLPTRRATFRQLSTSSLADPIAQLIDNLEREQADLQDLRSNTDRLVTRTIQLVNIRLEDHGKAILVFTVVTIVFLPLNFVSSFFGMNVEDIRNMVQGQWLFWAVALCVTSTVVVVSVFLAFSLGEILEKIHMWRDARKKRSKRSSTAMSQENAAQTTSFRVHGIDKIDWNPTKNRR